MGQRRHPTGRNGRLRVGGAIISVWLRVQRMRICVRLLHTRSGRRG
jgi:hypothetical protein